LFCRRDLELHWPSGVLIGIVLLRLAVRGRAIRFRQIMIRMRQIFSPEAKLGLRRALSVSSTAAFCAFHAGPSVVIAIVRCRLLNSRREAYPNLK
jgi:hypothetical protein